LNFGFFWFIGDCENLSYQGRKPFQIENGFGVGERPKPFFFYINLFFFSWLRQENIR